MKARNFSAILTEAVADFAEHGFESSERLDYWLQELRRAAVESLISEASLQQQLKDALSAAYRRMVDQGGYARFQPGVPRFTIDKVKPKLRAELDRRIRASANLIKLNRQEAIEKTMRRFSGWAASVPPGGISAESKGSVKIEVRKSLAGLPFEERRVIIDQGHKLTASINDVIAKDGGAIAARWHSNWRQMNYDYREEHKERDQQVYLIRDSWAHQQGLVKKGPAGYFDEITQPGQEVFCRCVPGSTQIPFANIRAIYRREYRGPLIKISTALGKSLRLTPNHPVLTEQGWCAAELLNVGDNIIESCDEIIDAIAEKYKNNGVSTIAEIFELLSPIGSQSTARGSSHQFHGDGRPDSNVDIVTTNRPLRINVSETILEKCNKLGFSQSNKTSASLSYFGKLNLGFRLAAMCKANSFSAFFSYARRFIRNPDSLRFRPGAQSDSILAYAQANGSVGDSISSGKRIGAVPRQIFGNELFSRQILFLSKIVGGRRFSANGDSSLSQSTSDRSIGNSVPDSQFHGIDARNIRPSKIISIEREPFSGHVYNLSTDEGWYVANGIITHNCHCIYIYNLRDLPDEMLTARGRTALASVRGSGADRATSRGTRADATPAHADPLDAVRRLDRRGYLRGVRKIEVVPDYDQWHASYDEDADAIEVEAKLEGKSFSDQVHVLLHEVGHRGQVVDRALFERFLDEQRDQCLDRHDFVAMANPIHLEDYREHGEPEGGIPAEVWAESYARHCLGLDMPVDLARFWAARSDCMTQREARYVPHWANRVTRCARCSMFVRLEAGGDENACTAVCGPIRAHGHCALFEIADRNINARASPINSTNAA